MTASLLAAVATDLSAGDVLDIVAAVVIAVGAITGLLRGLSGELARIAALVAAVVAAWAVSGPWRELCGAWFPQSPVALGIASLVGVFAVSTLAGWMVRKMVDKCLRVLVPQPINAILGFAAGLASLFLLVAVVCYLLHLVPVDCVQKNLLGPSRTWRAVSTLFGWQLP